METLDYFQTQIQIAKNEKRIRFLLWVFITALFLTGISAVPLEWGSEMLLSVLDFINIKGQLLVFAQEVHRGIIFNNDNYSFIAYGTDWLAFGHVMFAILFYGPVQNPFKNKWIIIFGMIASVLIIPTAFIMGHFRGIPLLWRMLDSSFGVIGFAVLYFVLKKMQEIDLLKRQLRTFHRKNISQEKPAA